MGMRKVRYTFQGPGAPKFYEIEFDDQKLSLVRTEEPPLPEWTRLEYCKCEGCPLNEADHPRCPPAANLAEIVGAFENDDAGKKMVVRVQTPERTYVKETTLKAGLFSIMGLIMGLSDCPHMTFLKPLARFHLPFADWYETAVRTASMFLLRQYVESKKAGKAEVDLAGLERKYAAMNAVNAGLNKRIMSVSRGTADTAALGTLQSFTTLLSYGLDSSLKDIEPLFEEPGRTN